MVYLTSFYPTVFLFWEVQSQVALAFSSLLLELQVLAWCPPVVWSNGSWGCCCPYTRVCHSVAHAGRKLVLCLKVFYDLSLLLSRSSVVVFSKHVLVGNWMLLRFWQCS